MAAWGKGSPLGLYTVPVIKKKELQDRVISAVTIPSQINWQPVKLNSDNM